MSASGRYELSSSTFRYWIVNNVERTIEMHLQDGQVLREPLEARVTETEQLVTRSVFDWEHWWVYSFTARGHLVMSEGYNPHAAPPFNGRPSVYLDQNQWRIVADALAEPIRVRGGATLKAARRLIDLVNDGGVVLPISTGHMVETAGLHGDRRYDIGVRIAALSGGWEIRHPMDSWRREVMFATLKMLGREGEMATDPAISTAPGRMFDSETDVRHPPAIPDNELLLEMLTMPNVILAMLITPDRDDKEPGTQWIDHNRLITRQLSALGGSKEQRQATARRRFYNDNIALYASAYRQVTGLADAPSLSDKQLKQHLSDSAMSGLLAELFMRRWLDRLTKWKRNDLIDMMHLSNAAAHVDYVVAEAHTGSQLRQALRSLGRPVNVYANLIKLVEALDRNGVRTVTEREAAG